MKRPRRLKIEDWAYRRPIFNLQSSILVLVPLCLLLTACRSTPEVTKIGLIAPFEGLSRRAGYTALAAMRGALEDAGATEMAILPLALDDGDNPARARRSARKLLADPAVVAVIGPLTPWTAAGAASVLEESPHWITPFAITPEAGFVDPRMTNAWADAWVAQVAQAVRRAGQERLVLAGWRLGWPDRSAAQWAEIAGMPVALADNPDAVQGGDAVVWLGSAADGAAYLAELRAAQPTTPFWMGAQGGDPVFLERICPGSNRTECQRTSGVLDFAYWTSWTPIEYNPAIAPNFPGAPDAQLVYLATRVALHRITADSSPDSSLESIPGSANWQLQIFEFSSGESVPAPVEK